MNTMLFEERCSCKYKTDFIFNVGCKFVLLGPVKISCVRKVDTNNRTGSTTNCETFLSSLKSDVLPLKKQMPFLNPLKGNEMFYMRLSTLNIDHTFFINL